MKNKEPKARKVIFAFQKSHYKPGYGMIYCVGRISTYKKLRFSLGIVISEKEWKNYTSVNYYFQTRMPSLGVLYHKFADVMDMIADTASSSDWKDAQLNVQRLMMKKCTLNL